MRRWRKTAISGALMACAVLGLNSSVVPRSESYRSESLGASVTRLAAVSPDSSMPKGDLPEWKQVWSQDFNQDAALGKFHDVYSDIVTYTPGTQDTSHNAVYDNPRTVSAKDGLLDIHLHTYENVARGAVIVPNNWDTQVYGRYSVRFRSDPVQGYGNAFLLWPGNNVWNEGEIDFPEGSLDGTMGGFVHEVGENPARNVLAIDTKTYSGAWHVATTEWTPERVTFFLDGKKVGETTDPQGIPKTPMRWTLQVASHWAKPPVDTSGHMQIDWMTYYSLKGQNGPILSPTPPDDTNQPPVAYASQTLFTKDIPLGGWPGDSTSPPEYPNFVTYADGTGGKYYPSKVLSVHDGVLDWHVHNQQAAAVLPYGWEGIKYGTYSVRMRTDKFPQYHIAFLLWPQTDQWTHELDGPEEETSSAYPYPAVFQGRGNGFLPSTMVRTPKSWNDAEFHNYTWQWGPDFVAFYQDGVEVTRVTQNVPQENMRPVLQVEFSNRLAEGVKPDASIEGHVYVDRVMYDPSYTIAVPTDTSNPFK